MKQKNKSIAELISIRPQTVVPAGIYLDPETRDDLKDKKHLLAVKKSREEYSQGKFQDAREFLKTLK